MLRDNDGPARDAHLRALLDTRQPRFSAVSDYSASIYSPRPQDDQRSTLDLDDDLSSYHDHNSLYDPPHDDDPDPGRLSYLGPKMRFHSRAPWEQDGGFDDEDDEDEPEDIPRPFAGGFPFARRRPSGSSSPRPSFQTTRPSAESSRSQILPKRSFDTTNSQISYPRGALYALAQESMSATSLGQVSHHQPKGHLRSKFSLSRLRPDTPTGPLPPPPVPPISPAHSRFTSSPTSDRPQEIQSAPPHQSTHPYANPELVVSYSNDDSSSSNYHSSNIGSHYASYRNDSNLTVTEAFSTDSMTKSSSQATLTPDSSINSITSKPRSSAILAKNISSPVPVVITQPDQSASDRSQDHSTHNLPPGVSNLPGWTERNVAPTFNLISLEEARALRMRNTNISLEASRNSSSSGSRTSSAFPPDIDTDSSPANTSQGSDGSPFGRARGRSVSAGTKAKSALQTIVGQSKADRREPEVNNPSPQSATNSMPAAASGGRTIKHKKSGFMRLFNGSKEKDDGPPPVPTLPEHHVSNTPQRTPKSVQRIPVPSLSPSLYEAASAPGNDSVTGETPTWKSSSSNQRRTPPTLSIRTMPSGAAFGSPTTRASVSATADTRTNNNASGYVSPLDTPDSLPTARRPWATAESQPQSAPAHVTEFPSLRLRPVSTLFSEHFSEHIVPLNDTSRPGSSGAKDAGLSHSTSSMAPLTPPASALSSSSGPGVPSIRGGADGSMVAEKQRQIWELEGQVRDLKAELEEAKGRYGDEYCTHCGRGKKVPVASLNSVPIGGVVNRPRARTGTSSRFVNGNS